MRLAEAVASGDRRKAMECLRDVIADQIDKTESGRDVAALSKRLLEVLEALDTLPDDSVSPLAEARRKYAS